MPMQNYLGIFLFVPARILLDIFKIRGGFISIIGVFVRLPSSDKRHKWEMPKSRIIKVNGLNEH